MPGSIDSIGISFETTRNVCMRCTFIGSLFAFVSRTDEEEASSPSLVPREQGSNHVVPMNVHHILYSIVDTWRYNGSHHGLFKKQILPPMLGQRDFQRSSAHARSCRTPRPCTIWRPRCEARTLVSCTTSASETSRPRSPRRRPWLLRRSKGGAES